MKSSVFIFVMVLVSAVFCFSEAAQPPVSLSPVPQAVMPASASSSIPVINLGSAPVILPQIVPAGKIAVTAPSAPPAWVQDVLSAAESLPIIGPIVSKCLLYAGILGTILTALVAFLLGAASLVQSVANVSKLNGVVVFLQDFQNGPVIYWLKYFSFFNAKPSAQAAADILVAKKSA